MRAPQCLSQVHRRKGLSQQMHKTCCSVHLQDKCSSDAKPCRMQDRAKRWVAPSQLVFSAALRKFSSPVSGSSSMAVLDQQLCARDSFWSSRQECTASSHLEAPLARRYGSSLHSACAAPDKTPTFKRHLPDPISSSSSMRAPPVYRTSTTPFKSESLRLLRRLILLK